MTEQQIDRERLRHRAGAGYTVFLRPEETTSILDALEQAEARIKAVEDVLGRHPDPRCDKHPSGDPITCGWKHAYADIRDALDSDAQP